MCRSDPLMRFNSRSANPVMFKLKAKDFEHEEFSKKAAALRKNRVNSIARGKTWVNGLKDL